MYMRNNITRTLKYSKVTVKTTGEEYTYIVNSFTTVNKEMKKYLNKYNTNDIPQITVNLCMETRTMSLDTFILNSEKVNEGEC